LTHRRTRQTQRSLWTAKPLARFLLVHLLCSAPVFAAQSGTGVNPNLKSELREALLRDAECGAKTAKAEQVADREQFLATVQTQPLHGPRGVEIGVIATPSDLCRCPTANCKQYVYLISGETYRLVLEENFESLRPMKAAKLGVPSLTGKIRVNATTTENIIFNWNGSEYSPGVCATVTQRKGSELPAIAYHPCESKPATKAAP
jgi:hypothetical protein